MINQNCSKKDLFLVVKKEFFIRMGDTKFVEVRSPSKWLFSRIFDKEGKYRYYDTVTFQCGYKKNAERKTFVFSFFDLQTVDRIYDWCPFPVLSGYYFIYFRNVR